MSRAEPAGELPSEGSGELPSSEQPLQRALRQAYGQAEPATEESSVLGSLKEITCELRPVRLHEPDGDPMRTARSGSEAPLQSSELPEGIERLGRYRLLGEIGRGGMGVVLHGRDMDLGREVAIKVLLQAHVERPHLVDRFVEEAQIGGQLQHPGIAPVHELGLLGKSRPYFATAASRGKRWGRSSRRGGARRRSA